MSSAASVDHADAIRNALDWEDSSGLLAAVDAWEAESQQSELEVRQNELHLAMGVVEEMPASEAQTACIVKLAERMRKLVEIRGKSEVGRSLGV